MYESLKSLGRSVEIKNTYDKKLLEVLPRKYYREPMLGNDEWVAYEIAWLNKQQLPERGILQVIIPANSPYIVESKSVKLYFNSLNHTCFESRLEILTLIREDFQNCLEFSDIKVNWLDDQMTLIQKIESIGVALDKSVQSDFNNSFQLAFANSQQNSGDILDRVVYTHTFRSLCPVTSQPDWASIFIKYHGKPLPLDALKAYLFSYYTHESFHEFVIEQIFYDLMEWAQLEKLCIVGRFLRRGGIEINPMRCNDLNYQLSVDRTVFQ